MKTHNHLIFVLYMSRRRHSTLSEIFARTMLRPTQGEIFIQKTRRHPTYPIWCLTEIANKVATTIRTKPRWESTLVSDFPNVNFSDPQFFYKVLRLERNVVFSVRFFIWVSANYEFKPDERSCALIFERLVKAKTCEVAKWFIQNTGFEPKGRVLEFYVRCLGESGCAEEAVEIFERTCKEGVCFGVKTWNLGLSGCLIAGRTDLLWRLYGLMIQSEVLGGIDDNTLGCLVTGFVEDGNEEKGDMLLRQGLDDGLVPGNDVFNRLISRFVKKGMYGRMSKLLHVMIARGSIPDVDTYEEIINGLCEKENVLEAFRIFNDLKDRGYAPDVVMYTTMIRGFCKKRLLGYARKLWFEMIDKGMLPDESTYNALVLGFSKTRNFEEARRLIDEMCDKGYSASTLTYNTMIDGLCLHGEIKEARKLFEEMCRKGVVRDVITYNILISGFCKRGKPVESLKLFKELLDQGFQPTIESYTSLIQKLCEDGDVQEAKRLNHDMQSRHLKTPHWIHDHIISGLCKQELVEEAIQWLPKTKKLRCETFESLINRLYQMDRLDDCFRVLSLMLKLGHLPSEGICVTLVTKLCKQNSSSVNTCLEQIMQTK